MKRRTKFRLIVIGTVILAGILFILYNENGIIRHMELKKEVEVLGFKIDSMTAENKRLEMEIDSLEKKIPAKIERTAREKYDMLRKGEKTVEVIER